MGDGTVGGLRRSLVLAAAVLVAACTADAGAPGAGALLVTETGRGAAILIPDGSNREVLREADGSSGPLQPTASWDGRAVAWTEDGPSVAVWRDGQVTGVPITFPPFFYLWRPDGSSLIALGNDPDRPAVAAAVVEPGGEATVLASGTPFYLDWHPDLAELVVNRNGSELVRLGLDGSLEPLGPAPGRFQAPAFTASGDLLVLTGPFGGGTTASLVEVAAAQTEGGELVLIRADGGPPQLVFEVPGAAAFYPSPDGTRVAIVELEGSRSLDGRLVVVTVAGGEVVELTASRAVLVDWNPDGSRLLYAVVEPEGGVMVPFVWDGVESVEYPSYRPTPTFVAEYLPFWDQYERSLTVWSPRGDAFAYAALIEGEGRVLVQTLDEPAPTDVAPGVFVSWVPGEQEG
jgi:hypothetical protein